MERIYPYSPLWKQLEAELQDKYGWHGLEIVHTTMKAAKDIHKAEESFITHVYRDWEHLGVTVITCGNNNLDKWVEAILQTGLKGEDFFDEW